MPSIKGIWRWKDAVDFSSVSGYITQDVNFTSNGESFGAIEIRPTLLFYYSSVSSGSEQIAVGDGTSVQDAYKQIDFGDTAQTVSDEFYAVFSANADATDFIIQMGAVYPVKLLTKGCYLDKNIRILPPPIDEPVFEERTVTPTAQMQEVTPGEGYDGLSKVIVNPVPTETKIVTPTEQEQIIRGSEGSFLSSVSVKAIQASEKTVTENGEYTPTSGAYYKKVTVNVPQYTDVSATTAQADDVLQGKSFYPYNGAPLTEGTIPVQTPSNPEFTSKTDAATFPKGYYSGASTVKIADTEQAKIIPENIKKDTVILGVTGTFEGGTDTTDATAAAADILSGKTAYVNGVKLTGTIETYTGEEVEDALAGTWVLNDTIIYTNVNAIISFNFTSNNTSFYGFYFDVNSDGDNSLGYRTNQQYSFNQIYNSGGNIISGKETYKTITITSKLSEVTNGEQLLAWLQANATKQ